MPASASQGAGAAYTCNCGWQYLKRLPSHNCMKMFPVVLVGNITTLNLCRSVLQPGDGETGYGTIQRELDVRSWLRTGPVSEHADSMYFAEWREF